MLSGRYYTDPGMRYYRPGALASGSIIFTIQNGKNAFFSSVTELFQNVSGMRAASIHNTLKSMNTGNISVLIVEDDVKLAKLTSEYLIESGVNVHIEHRGDAGLQQALARNYDLILLDLMLPNMDGVEVCKRIRRHSNVPIIMITARREEADRILGLEMGADDYILKPFSARELLARIRAVVRRTRDSLIKENESITVGDLTLEPRACIATLNGTPLSLTTYQFSLLYELVRRAGRVLSREQIMTLSRGSPEVAFDRSVDIHISRLRKKLHDDPRNPSRIVTVRGRGYMYVHKT